MEFNRQNIFKAMGAKNSSPERKKQQQEQSKEVDTFVEFARDIGVMAKFQDIQTMFDILDKQSYMTTRRLNVIDDTVSDTIPYAISDTFEDTEYQALNHAGYGGRNKPEKGRDDLPRSKKDFDNICKSMYRDFTSDTRRYKENEEGEPVFDAQYIREFTELVEQVHEYYTKRLPSIENLRHAEVAPSPFFESHPAAREQFSHADQIRIVDLESVYEDGEDDLLVALAVRHGVKLKDVRAYMAELDGMPDEKRVAFGIDTIRKNALYGIKKELSSLIAFAEAIHTKRDDDIRAVPDQSIRLILESRVAFELVLDRCILPIKEAIQNKTLPDDGYRDSSYRSAESVKKAVDSFLTEYHELVQFLDKEMKTISAQNKRK